MLQIKHLQMIHKKDLRVLFQDFHFVVNPGDKIVIIGEEGNGKSTLLKWIYQEQSVEDYVEVTGEKICHHETFGYLPQELSQEEKEMTVYEFFTREELFFNFSPNELGKMADEVHLSREFYYEEQKMGSLSGGEKVKACLLRIQMNYPTILLLDEPSNDLDMDTLAWLERMIHNTEQAVVFISHDETLIERTANQVIHLEQINRKRECRFTIFKGSYREYLASRSAFIENQEQLANNLAKEQKKKETRLREILDKVEHAQNAVSRQDPHTGQLLKKKMKAVKSMERRFEREKEELPQKLDYEDAIFFKLGQTMDKVPNGKVVLDYSLEVLESKDHSRVLSRNIHLLVKGAQKVVILGDNGVGKTTLIEKMMEDLKNRTDIKVLYMPQNYDDLLDMGKNPIDYLDQSGDKGERTKIRTYLGALKLTADEMLHPMSDLSGGQKGKIFLLKLSLSDANVLILDEPTRNFSPLSGPVIRRMLKEFPGAIISISHDRKYIHEVCTKCYRLSYEGLEEVELDPLF